MYQQDDSHVAACDYFNYSVCYSASKTVSVIEGTCSEGFLLSLYQENNAHVSSIEGYYNFSICVNEFVCSSGTSCPHDSIVSLFQPNNSHVGSLGGYYNYSLCCQNTGYVQVYEAKETGEVVIDFIVKIFSSIFSYAKLFGVFLFILLILWLIKKVSKKFK